MPRFDRIKVSVAEALASHAGRVFRLGELRQLRGRVAVSVRPTEFLDLLLQEKMLRRVELQSPRYRGFIRFALPEATPFEVALSLRQRSYLSHASAVFLHGLTDQLPHRIFVNREQSAKPESRDNPITQGSLKKAFARPQRESSYVLNGPGYEVVLLSGKQTGNLEVGSLPGPQREDLDATRLERTLIDITVRPLYAGGIYQVLESFRAARERVSVGVLLATLKRLRYRYPYHQAIGFYMERAGYAETLLQRIEQLGIGHDFYLAHGLRRSVYAARWRLHVPEGL